ncbi:MAG: S1C family serine protease [Undibacterium sp.]
MKPFFRSLALIFLLATLAGIAGAFAYTALFPKLVTWPLTAGIPWPTPLSNSTTIIERTEQVVLSPEEGIERFIPGPRTSVVSIVSTFSGRTTRAVNVNPMQSVMSGVLLTNDGLIATYATERPVSENRDFTVLFADGQNSKAAFVAFDEVVNIAYYRTERSDTASIAFANSNDIRPGRRYIAIAGTSTGEGERVAAGVISEYSRTFNLSGKTVASSDKWEGAFFLDRALGRDFSGGTVVAMNGELIGLIGTTTLDGRETVFVLPSNTIRRSLERLSRLVTDAPRQTFGAYYLSITPAVMQSFGLSHDRGAYIYTPSEKTGLAVIAGSLAERLGLRYGDIVLSVNNQEINLDRPLSVALDDVLPGESLRLQIERSGKPLELQATR